MTTDDNCWARRFVVQISTILRLSVPAKLVAWHSGRTSVSGRRTSPVLRSTCSCCVTTLWINRPLRVSQPGQRSIFSARCNIYISRLCYDVSVRLSVRLSGTFVHSGHRVQWIQDTFACLDRWMSLLLTDNASHGSSHNDAGISGGRGEESSRAMLALSLIHIWRCRRSYACRSRWSPYH